jgi:hypothetical protein
MSKSRAAAIDPDDRGMASGIFETCAHLGGGAAGVALYATVLTATAEHADGYRGASLAGVALACTGLLAAWMSRTRRPQIR